MKRFICLLLVALNAQCMDLAQKKEINSLDEIEQLIENKPYPKPLWDDLGFVTDPCTRCIMSPEQYAHYRNQPQHEETRKYLKSVVTSSEKLGSIAPIFEAHKNFNKTWVAGSMLLHAVEVGCTATTQKLLEFGISNNKVSTFFTQYWKGELPLNVAVKKRDLTMVKVLLDGGADPNCYDRDGNEGTALMVALESYFGAEDTAIDTDIINLLLEYKARPNGQTLLFVKDIKYNSLPKEAISKHQKYEHWQQNRKLTLGEDFGVSSATELAQELCLDNWVEIFKKHAQQ